jgi:hypothetical protein
MALGDDAVAGGQGGSGIAAAYAEGKREIGRSENGNRPAGAEYSAQVGLGERLAAWIGGVDGGVDPRAIPRDASKHFELIDRSAALAGNSGAWQGGFFFDSLQERIAEVENVGGDFIEQISGPFRRKVQR